MIRFFNTTKYLLDYNSIKRNFWKSGLFSDIEIIQGVTLFKFDCSGKLSGKWAVVDFCKIIQAMSLHAHVTKRIRKISERTYDSDKKIRSSNISKS